MNLYFNYRDHKYEIEVEDLKKNEVVEHYENLAKDEFETIMKDLKEKYKDEKLSVCEIAY